MRNTPAIKYSSLSVLLLFLVVFFYHILFAPPKNFPINTIVTIQEGKATSFIAQDLKTGGIIRSAVLFKVFAKLFTGDAHIVAGDYLFESPTVAWTVASRLSVGDHGLKTIKITFPEGFTVKNMADLLAQKIPDFDTYNFLTLAKNKEGYLFPDTYFFYPNYGVQKIIDLMAENFEKKISPYRDEIMQSNHSLHEIIIMASLIEKESGGTEDKVPISSILWRRINIDLALQVDVAMETYDSRGLPAKPIANPGLDSILAALRPVKTSYLFYIHAPDGTAYYAENFEEHKANRVKYLNE